MESISEGHFDGDGSDAESIKKEIQAMDLMENSIPKIFGVKSDKLQHPLLNGRLLNQKAISSIVFIFT